MRRFLPDFGLAALLFLLPLIVFWPQTVGGRTLLPAENLYQYEPYASARELVSAPPPHNALLSDLVLQNMPWKLFIRQSLASGELPLWNPHQFSGIPFLAAGQQSALYPFSLLYYLLPLPAAYGWFSVVQLGLAGLFMLLFLRGLGVGRFGALLGGVVYQLSAFFITNGVFPMIMAAAVWLPLILLMVEFVIRQRAALRGRPASLPWAALGAAALGCNVLAGHVEITYYTLLITAYYAAARLLSEALRRDRPPLRHLAGRALWLGLMVGLGLGLGAVQFVPLFEFASMNYRDGRSSLAQVLGWAHPLRDLVQFALPNFYGSPAFHSYYDLFSGQTVSTGVLDWGIKNYVEGALYVGILPLALAVYALVGRRGAPYRWIFGLLGAAGLTFMFGLPTYALLYYGLPGFNQLHSPFRWIFAVTFSVAVLAGFGADALQRGDHPRRARRFGWALSLVGLVTLLGLLLSRLFFAQIEPLIERLVQSLAKAPEVFSDARMFYSFQFPQALIFGLVTLAGGVLLLNVRAQARRLWRLLTVALVALDLMIASWGFNPASDPALLDFTPPAIAWLQAQPGEWRYMTLDDPALPPLFNANLTWRYGLDDVRGYESIIPMQYVNYMRTVVPQRQLDFNRVSPIYTDQLAEVDWDRLRLLNVRYLITHPTTAFDMPGWSLAYEDAAVRIYASAAAFPRAFTVPEARLDAGIPALYDSLTAAAVLSDSGREKLIAVQTEGAARLIVSETYVPGWRAFIRRQDAAERDETPLETGLVLDNFIGVRLPEAGAWTVRLVYSPVSFQLGLFGTFISGVVLAFLAGVYLWRLVIARDEAASGSAVVARNSAAPIILSLFNRGIDFGFAFIMLRILGPEGSGIYYYAAFIFGWFDIFTNFGLNVFLTREVARDRTQARHLLVNTSALRLLLMGVGAGLLLAFIALRQTTVTPPLSHEGVLALALLYIGLFPNTLSTGLSALFYGFEKAEYPAAVTTVATINKAAWGVLALAAGFGVVGLAGVSIVTNIITLAVLAFSARGLFRTAPAAPGAAQRLRPDLPLIRRMVGQSWPLMLNHFLATIFFQIDIVIIEAAHGAAMVGQYSVAYKWVAALNVIPAFFTMALLPVMSRQAREDRPALRRTYRLAIKLLTATALPLAVIFTFLAYLLTGILGGSEFLPDGAIATQLMIWSIPIGWINSLTQYALIALDLQRRITWAFFFAVSFNIAANLIFIPAYGYRAAALTTIASELALLLAFGVLLAGALRGIGWPSLLWKQTAAAGLMLALLAVGWDIQPALALLIAGGGYAGALLLLRLFDADEWARLLPLLPAPVRRRVSLLS